jgi:hypothetical protein
VVIIKALSLVLVLLTSSWLLWAAETAKPKAERGAAEEWVRQESLGKGEAM